jgi:DNA invertase Pin-like site-specific DNA recombinase
LITLRDELQARKINLVSLRDALDLSTPSGRMMFAVLASIAEFETEVRRERQSAGIMVAKEQGVYKGRQLGLRNRKTSEAQATVRLMHSAGISVGEIAKTTGLSRPTIYKMVRG